MFQRLGKLITVICEILPEEGMSRKRDQEDLVVRMNSPREMLDSLDRSPDLTIHAPARVEQNAHTYRNIPVLAEMRNRSRLAILFEDEIGSAQIRHIAPVGIR